MAFSILLLSHVMNDFLLQQRFLVSAKKQKSKTLFFQPAILVHAICLFILSILIAVAESAMSWRFLLADLLVVICHYFIDYWKNLQKSKPLKVFLLDQLFHILSLALVCMLLGYIKFPLNFEKSIVMIKAHDLKLNHFSQLNLLGTWLVSLLWGIAYFVQSILQDKEDIWPGEGETYRETLKMREEGHRFERHIGYMERILILLFTLHQAYGAIVLLFIGKALVCRNKLKDPLYQDFFLYTTLLSFTGALIFSSLYRYFFFLVI